MLFVSRIHDPVNGAENCTWYCQIAKTNFDICPLLNQPIFAFALEKILSLRIIGLKMSVTIFDKTMKLNRPFSYSQN